MCIDGLVRLCVIRGKFSGKGKRENRINRGSWVLVGLRDWEISSKDKPKCDLLEVYNDGDKEKIIKNSRENFRIFLSINEDDLVDEEQLKFVNEREEQLAEDITTEYSNEEEGEEKQDEDDIDEKNKITNVLNQMDWVDINDI